MKETNKLGVDVDDIVKIIKASKTTCHDCQTNTCKVHKAGGTGKSDGSGKSASSQIKMNKGGRFSGRAGRPSSQSNYTNEVFRQIPATTLQADTAKLNNDLAKFQLELTQKQAENNQLQNNQLLQNYQMINNQQQNRFKSNKFLNDDDDYGTPPRFNNDYFSPSLNLSMLYDQKKRIDALESGNYFSRMMGNSQFAPTESPQIEFVENDDGTEKDENIVDEKPNSNSPFSLSSPNAEVDKKTGIFNKFMSRPKDYFKRMLPTGGGKAKVFPQSNDGFTGNVSIFDKNTTDYQYDHLNSPFVGYNPMESSVGVSVNNNKQIKKTPQKSVPPPKQSAGFAEEEEEEEDEIPSGQKPENKLKQKKRANTERLTEFNRDYLLEKIREHNNLLPKKDRIKDLHKKKVWELEKIFNVLTENEN
jgi:hypothetical protein